MKRTTYLSLTPFGLFQNHFAHKQYSAGGSIRKYKLGDTWSKNFDYKGMLKEGLKADISWNLGDLKKLQKSFTDVNYHSESTHLWKAIEELEKRPVNEKEAENHIKLFHEKVEETLAETTFSAGGAVGKPKILFEKSWSPEGTTYNQTIRIDKDTFERLKDAVASEIALKYPRKSEYSSTSGYEIYLKPLKSEEGFVWMNHTQTRFVNLFLHLKLRDDNTRLHIAETTKRVHTGKTAEYKGVSMLNFKDTEAFQQYVRKNKTPDYVMVDDVPYTMDEYDGGGQEITYGNKTLEKNLLVTTENRYGRKGFTDAVVEQIDSGVFRNDISYLDESHTESGEV